MIIRVSNLGKRFNREWIFKGLNAEFISGKSYAITGPNGSGKSTLMKILWGQEPASIGNLEYSIEGKAITPDEIFKCISIVTPYMDLIEELTLSEQVNFHFKFKKTLKGIDIQSLYKRIGLQTAIDKPIKQFSSGMKQRLKLGLAFYTDSPAIFLDEPTTNLDDKATQWYHENLSEILPEKLVFIATNQASDYPTGSTEINLSDLKLVTK